MKAKIIDLIKKYRAESERDWSPNDGYRYPYAQQHAEDCDHFADDLEGLLKEEEKAD